MFSQEVEEECFLKLTFGLTDNFVLQINNRSYAEENLSTSSQIY